MSLDYLMIDGAEFAVSSTPGGGAPVPPLSDCTPLPVLPTAAGLLAGLRATTDADARAVFGRLGVGVA